MNLLAVALQVLGFAGLAAGAYILWGVGWAVLVGAVVCLVAGAVLELDVKHRMSVRATQREVAQQLRRAA